MSQQTTTGYSFGTFKGVFTPSILTILGVVMYLRLGWVLGNLGLPATIAVVTLASSITFLTALSLSALATNMRVGGGGAYYIISRSLGVEAGAAIGLPLYLAQVLGISFYIAGFTESLVQVFPTLDAKPAGVATLLVLTALVYRSADLALKSQYLIMAAIAVSLVAFFFGHAPPPPTVPADGVLPTMSFWPVFAIFFPAVTGIEAGIAMSGDLKNPTRSLPAGTIMAVLVGFVIYLAIPVFLAAQGVDRQTLLTDSLVMSKVARWESTVLLGIWAASLSSALGALLGAPRTLQALAADRVVPVVLGRGFGKFRDPRYATVVSFLIALAGILVGGMNVIAPVLSMFFLTSYGVLNLSAGMEELISNPAWRPRFRIPAWLPLTGAIACLGVMLMIAPGATIIAIVICSAIYYAMKRRTLGAHWGDIRLGFMMFVARTLLYRMAGMRLDERTWKPNLLVLSGSPSSRWHLIELADAIAQSRSFVTVAAFIPEENWTKPRIEQLTDTIRAYLNKRHVPAFIRALPAADPYHGAATMIRSYGFGPIAPNTVLIGVTENPSNFVAFAELIQLTVRSEKNLIVVRQRDDASGPAPERSVAEDRHIDLWWSETSPHPAFMLAVAVLLRRSEDWEDAALHFKTIVDTDEEKENALQRWREFMTRARLDAMPEVMVRGDEETFDIIKRSSRAADLVFLGMRAPASGESATDYSSYYQELLTHTEAFATTVLVVAAEQVEFYRIFDN